MHLQSARGFLVLLLGIQLVLLASVSLPSVAAGPSSTQVPTRSWYFHGFVGPSGETFVMNESLPTNVRPSSRWYPDQCVRGSLIGCNNLNATASSVQYSLAPAYQYGFHILQENFNVDTYFIARANVCSTFSCPSTTSDWSANLNFTLMTGSGHVIGSSAATIVFTNFASLGGGQYLTTEAFKNVTVSMPAPITLGPGETAYFTLTLLNPDAIHLAYLETGSCEFIDNLCGATSISHIVIPANFYSSRITASSSESIKLGQSIMLSGTLTSLWNNTAIPDQTVKLVSRQTACYEYLKPSPVTLAVATTSSTGEYSFSWTPQSVGAYCITAYYDGSEFFYHSISAEDGIVVAPAATSLTIQVSQAFGLTTNAYRISGHLKGLNGPIVGSYVVVEYTVPAPSTPSLIGASKTDSSGNYAVTWAPSGTGNFTIIASYSGTTSQEQQQATANLYVQNLYLGPNLLFIAPPVVSIAGIGPYLYLRFRKRKV